MTVYSKWQQLPTEAINPATLGIDKLSPAGIIDAMLDEDRKIMSAITREKERIALGVELSSHALRKGGRLVFIGVDPVAALYYSAVINGVVAVPLLIIIFMIGNNKKILGERTSGKLSNVLLIITTLLMGAAAAGLFFL